MIDTTGWRIQVSLEQAKRVRDRSKEFSEYDHETQTTNFRIIRKNLYIGSHDSNITIKCNEDNQIYIEFSVPKQFLGNNVELLYPSQLEQALAGVHQSLVDHFGDFPSYKSWQLVRLDLCYGWRYSSQEEADSALNILRTLEYPRKTKHNYKTTIMWRGKSSSVKFYLKHPEFRKHGIQKLNEFRPLKDEKEDEEYKKKEDLHNYYKRIFELSIGVLRFEITMRKSAIDYMFKSTHITYENLLSQEKLEAILNRNLNIITMNLDKNVMTDRDNIKRLTTCYTSQKAIRLFSFFKVFTSAQINNRQILRENYSSTTIWRNKKDIALAKVGLPSHIKPLAFKLEIPSDYVVNPDKAGSSAS